MWGHLAAPPVVVSFSAVVLEKDDQGEHLQCQGLFILCCLPAFLLLVWTLSGWHCCYWLYFCWCMLAVHIVFNYLSFSSYGLWGQHNLMSCAIWDWQGEVGPGTLTSNPSGDCGCGLGSHWASFLLLLKCACPHIRFDGFCLASLNGYLFAPCFHGPHTWHIPFTLRYVKKHSSFLAVKGECSADSLRYSWWWVYAPL